MAVVIPCLNEGKTIYSLVREVRGFVSWVLVVDDGSEDETAAEAQRAGARVVRHSVAKGKGAALQTGMEVAVREGFEWALAMDGDGQHAATDIPRFLGRAEERSPAMIIGNRMANARAMPVVRRLVNRWMSDVLGAYCGAKLPDSQCGFRLINLNAWRQVCFSAQHFEIESELIVRFIKQGFRVEFVPVECRYASERSKIRPLRDTMRWFRWWRAIRRELAREEPRPIQFEPQFERPTNSAPHFAQTAQDATA